MESSMSPILETESPTIHRSYMPNSYVIWIMDGTRYTYAWGNSPEGARQQYLDNWTKGVTKVVPSSEYLDALPFNSYLPSPTSAVWPEASQVPGQPLYEVKP